jgi:hypothetical protein
MFFVAFLALLAAAILGMVTNRRHATLPPSIASRSVYGFVSWAVAGFLGVGGLLSIMSIGLLLLPLGAVAVFLAARRFSIGVETIGSIAGAGLAFVGVAIANLGSKPCPPDPFVLRPGQLGAVECGGPSPTLWLLAGLACILVAVVVTVWLERRPHQQGASSHSSPGAPQ